MPDVQVVGVQPMRRDPYGLGLGPEIAHKINHLLESCLERLDIFRRDHVIVLVMLDVPIVHPQEIPGAAIDL